MVPSPAVWLLLGLTHANPSCLIFCHGYCRVHPLASLCILISCSASSRGPLLIRPGYQLIWYLHGSPCQPQHHKLLPGFLLRPDASSCTLTTYPGSCRIELLSARTQAFMPPAMSIHCHPYTPPPPTPPRQASTLTTCPAFFPGNPVSLVQVMVNSQ